MEILTTELIRERLPAKEKGSKPDGTVPDDVLRRGADAILADRLGDGVWVFAYGALIWERPYASDGERIGTLHGMARQYCLRDDRNRGTPEHPSLTLGLVPDRGACSGLVVHLAEPDLTQNFWAVWEHEMAGGFYNARWVQVLTAAGPLDAITFVADPLHPLFAGLLDDDAVADILATAAGPGGPAADYLRQTSDAMRHRGAPDPYLERLASLVAARLGAA